MIKGDIALFAHLHGASAQLFQTPGLFSGFAISSLLVMTILLNLRNIVKMRSLHNDLILQSIGTSAVERIQLTSKELTDTFSFHVTLCYLDLIYCIPNFRNS